MDWTNITNLVMLTIGSGGLISTLVTLAKARPEKISYEIKNLREVIEEMKQSRLEDRKTALEDKKVLEKRISQLESSNTIFRKAIEQYIKCRYIPQEGVCPITDFMNKSEEIIKRTLESLKEQEDNDNLNG